MNFTKQNTFSKNLSHQKNSSNSNSNSQKKSNSNNNNNNSLIKQIKSAGKKLPNVNHLLKSNSTNNFSNVSKFNSDNINDLKILDTPSKGEFEEKCSSELNFRDEGSSKREKEKNKSKKQIKRGKTNDNLRDSSSKNDLPSLAEIISIDFNNNNNRNTSSSSSHKTIAKPFNKNGLLNKSQLKLASYIEQNKDVTLTGTKRFTDKSGEYYLKNVQLQKKQDKQGPLTKKLSLTKPQNLDNCFSKLNGNLNKIRKNATKIITILPENSLTPIPVKEQNSVRGMAQIFNKKQYENAERVAVFIRRMEYSNGFRKHFNYKSEKKNNDYINKVIFIQEWWKAMYQIIMIQKCTRGFLFRKNLMKILEHQENILKFITTFYNIHGFHLYRTFFDNLKKMLNAINSKKAEMMEDFSEKMEKIENMNNLRKLRLIFLKWKKMIQKQIKKEKAIAFRKNNYLKKGIKGLKMNLISKLIEDTLGNDKNNNKLLNEILNNKYFQNTLKAVKALNKIIQNNNNKIKKDIFQKLKLFYFMNILSNIKGNRDNIGVKEAFEKIKKLYVYYIKKDSFQRWKEITNLNKILQNLKIKKQKEVGNNRIKLLKALSIWKTKTDKKQILDSLKQYQIKANKLLGMVKKLNALKEKSDKDKIKEAFDLMKKFYDESKTKAPQFKKFKIKLVKKEINDDNNNNINNNNLDENNNQNSEKKFKKRITYRKRFKSAKKDKKKKKDQLKEKLDQLKKVVLLLIIRLYKNKNNKLIKKYFDRWKNKASNQNQNQKYIKKVISRNSLNISKSSKLSDNINENINNNCTFDKYKVNGNINPEEIMNNIKNKNKNLLQNNNEKANDSDESSVNVSTMSGMNLEKIKSENLKPIIYTSQSFAIDKNIFKNIQNEIPKIGLYKNLNNKYPMKMKGDFRELIEKNKDLLKHINPRIQITNATCELEQFSEEGQKDKKEPKTYNYNTNTLNINPNLNITMNKAFKKRDLKYVIKNCDKDIYEPNKDYENEKQRWISMSIPLDNDMAKWEFLNHVKGIRNKNNINKFQLIQKNKSENNLIKDYNIKTIPKKNNNKEIIDLRNYNLNEMNYKQFYKSTTEDEKYNPLIRLVRHDNMNTKGKINHKYRINSYDVNIKKNYNKDNIEEKKDEDF